MLNVRPKVFLAAGLASHFAKTGGRILGIAGAAAEAMVQSEVERWPRIMKEVGITAQ